MSLPRLKFCGNGADWIQGFWFRKDFTPTTINRAFARPYRNAIGGRYLECTRVKIHWGHLIMLARCKKGKVLCSIIRAPFSNKENANDNLE